MTHAVKKEYNSLFSENEGIFLSEKFSFTQFSKIKSYAYVKNRKIDHLQQRCLTSEFGCVFYVYEKISYFVKIIYN